MRETGRLSETSHTEWGESGATAEVSTAIHLTQSGDWSWNSFQITAQIFFMNLNLCKKPAQRWSPKLSCTYCLCEFALAQGSLAGFQVRAQPDLLPVLCPAAFPVLREVQLSQNRLDLQSRFGNTDVAVHSPGSPYTNGFLLTSS